MLLLQRRSSSQPPLTNISIALCPLLLLLDSFKQFLSHLCSSTCRRLHPMLQVDRPRRRFRLRATRPRLKVQVHCATFPYQFNNQGIRMLSHSRSPAPPLPPLRISHWCRLVKCTHSFLHNMHLLPSTSIDDTGTNSSSATTAMQQS
eukprot:scpid89767/ scgid3014/ 